MTKQRRTMPKIYHWWTSSTTCGTDRANRQPPSTSAATRKPPKVTSPASAKGKRFRFLRYGTRRTSPLSTCWRPRKIKYLSAGHCWTAFTPPNIRLTPPCCNGCRTSARWHCWKECSKPPLPSSIRLTSRSIPTANLLHKSTPPKTYGSTNWWRRPRLLQTSKPSLKTPKCKSIIKTEVRAPILPRSVPYTMISCSNVSTAWKKKEMPPPSGRLSMIIRTHLICPPVHGLTWTILNISVKRQTSSFWNRQ